MDGLNIGIAVGLTLSGVLGLAYMYYVKGRAERRKVEREAMKALTQALRKDVDKARREYETALRDFKRTSNNDSNPSK